MRLISTIAAWAIDHPGSADRQREGFRRAPQAAARGGFCRAARQPSRVCAATSSCSCARRATGLDRPAEGGRPRLDRPSSRSASATRRARPRTPRWRWCASASPTSCIDPQSAMTSAGERRARIFLAALRSASTASSGSGSSSFRAGSRELVPGRRDQRLRADGARAGPGRLCVRRCWADASARTAAPTSGRARRSARRSAFSWAGSLGFRRCSAFRRCSPASVLTPARRSVWRGSCCAGSSALDVRSSGQRSRQAGSARAPGSGTASPCSSYCRCSCLIALFAAFAGPAQAEAPRSDLELVRPVARRALIGVCVPGLRDRLRPGRPRAGWALDDPGGHGRLAGDRRALLYLLLARGVRARAARPRAGAPRRWSTPEPRYGWTARRLADRCRGPTFPRSGSPSACLR